MTQCLLAETRKSCILHHFFHVLYFIFERYLQHIILFDQYKLCNFLNCSRHDVCSECVQAKVSISVCPSWVHTWDCVCEHVGTRCAWLFFFACVRVYQYKATVTTSIHTQGKTGIGSSQPKQQRSWHPVHTSEDKLTPNKRSETHWGFSVPAGTITQDDKYSSVFKNQHCGAMAVDWLGWKLPLCVGWNNAEQ